jgi:hypothetical protein
MAERTRDAEARQARADARAADIVADIVEIAGQSADECGWTMEWTFDYPGDFPLCEVCNSLRDLGYSDTLDLPSSGDEPEGILTVAWWPPPTLRHLALDTPADHWQAFLIWLCHPLPKRSTRALAASDMSTASMYHRAAVKMLGRNR